jgi:leucyl-tRNA synthetase
MGYGTGAIMAVPAHDERDFEFAKQFNLPVRQVIRPEGGTWDVETQGAFVEGGVMMNSGEFDGSPSEQGSKAVVAKLSRKKRGEETVHYRLRDWLISRQRYWGAPIPMFYCKACGIVPEKEKNLPVLLPYEIDLSKSRSGKSPLAFAPSFVEAKCPACGGAAKREVDTMDTFVDSSWYFLRYPSANLKEKPWDDELIKKWLPVDMYVGGAEHACMHLLYARFITMALHDAGLVPFEEPFPRLRHQGVITNRGAKMSKSRGNVVAPEPYLEKYGSDVFRMFLMFMGPYSDGGDWSDSGIHGIARFRDRVWRLFDAEGARKGRPAQTDAPLRGEFLRALHFTIREVTGDLEKFHFNTALSRLMEFSNFLQGSAEKLSEPDAREALKSFAQLLAPFAPHMGEELWERFVTSPPAPLSRGGEGTSIFNCGWPGYDPKWIETATITVIVQVNGRKRGEVSVPKDASEEQVREAALADESVARHVPDAKRIARAVYVPGRLVKCVV